MKIKRAVYFLFSLLILSGCDKEPKFEIYENHEISACAITDPVENSRWLSDFIDNNIGSTNNITIYLYSNNETKEENIVIDITPNRGENSNVSANPYFWKKVYFCSGEQLFITESGEIDYESWDNFFYSNLNNIKGIIWYRKIVSQ